MKIGIKVQPRRGIVAIRGHHGDDRFTGVPGLEVRKNVLDIQVLTPPEVELIRTCKADDELMGKCADFGQALHSLFGRYGIATWEED